MTLRHRHDTSVLVFNAKNIIGFSILFRGANAIIISNQPPYPRLPYRFRSTARIKGIQHTMNAIIKRTFLNLVKLCMYILKESIIHPQWCYDCDIVIIQKMEGSENMSYIVHKFGSHFMLYTYPRTVRKLFSNRIDLFKIIRFYSFLKSYFSYDEKMVPITGRKTKRTITCA